MGKNKLLEVLNRKMVRKVWYKEDWWYVIKDVIYVITKTADTKTYIKYIRNNNKKIKKSWSKIAVPMGIKMKKYSVAINCSNYDGIIKIILAIPSPKAAKIQLWIKNERM